MRIRSLFVLVIALSARGIHAQSLEIAPSTLVANAAPQHPIVEPQLAIDPTNPARLLAAAFLSATPGLKYPEGLDQQTCAAFLSVDSGATWVRHDFDVTWCFDPWVAITPDGHAVVTMVGSHSRFHQQGRSGLVAFHSSNAGATWDTVPIGLGSNHDHPTLAVDLSRGRHRGWIYVLSHRGRSADDGHYRYGIYVARSTAGGRTFGDPVWVIPNNLHNLAEMPVVLSDGTLLASFVDASFFPDSAAGSSREVDFTRRRAWVVRSSDGGFTFSLPLFITDACGPPPAYRLSVFAADISGREYDGRLYFACEEAGGGPIVVMHSRDRGETWSSVVRLQATARDSVVPPIPALAVNDRGEVLVAWKGASGSSADPCERNLYAAASLDGGTTFSPRVLVAPCAGGGDYFGIAAIPGGRFRLMWPETLRGAEQLRTTVIDVSR